MAEATRVAFGRALARLGVAVTRGLLLDLLATGDRAGVDAAMAQWIALNALSSARGGLAPEDRR